MKIKFRPSWETDSDLGLISLNRDVHIPLDVTEKLTLSLKAGSSTVYVGDFANRVRTVMVNGQFATFQVAGSSVVFRTLPSDSVVEIYVAPIVTFSITNGVLPNGLSLNGYSGVISGVVDLNNTAKLIFPFTVSVTNVSGQTVPRRFTLTIASDFKPVWQTESGLLGSYREGDIVLTSVTAVEENIYDIGPRVDFVVASGYAPRVLSVFDGNSAISFTVQGSEIHFAPLSVARKITIVTKPNLTYTVIAGSLPNGLTIDPATGDIGGTLANLTSQDSHYYEFTIRANNSLYLADRTFSMTVEDTLQLPEYLAQSLPKRRLIPDLRGYYYDLGVVEHGQAFTFSLDIRDIDQTNPSIVEGFFVNLPDNGVYFTGLPQGVSLVDNSIRGFVDPLGPAGIYVFAISLVVGSRRVSLNCVMQTILTIEPVATLLRRIIWNTPSGSLGTVYEGNLSTYSVSAKAVQIADIVYTLSPNSGPLPSGLRINSKTGLLEGQFAHVAKDTTTTFTIRATAGHDFSERTFSITVLNRFNTDEVYRFTMDISVIDDAKIFPDYQTIIPSQYIYRPSDHHFGLVQHGSVYLVSGIKANMNADEALADDPYRGRSRLLLGDHHVAVARDETGAVLYEVLYRTLHDPLSGAGGFMALDFPVVQDVIWPQSEEPFLYIYPRSMTNMRLDIINRMGFAANPPLTYLGGINGSENLPQWMRSEQVYGDSTTRIGFMPALVIAYLTANSATYVLRAINSKIKELAPNGHPLEFERYVAQYDRFFSGTIFESDRTNFDITTTFDDYAKGKMLTYGEKTSFDNGRLTFDGKTTFDRKNPSYN